MSEIEKLTPGQRAKLAIAGSMLQQFDGAGDLSAHDAGVDNAIASVAATGSPRYATTREDRAARQAALQQTAGSPAGKPKLTRDQVLDKLELKIAALDDEQRLAYVGRERSEEAQMMVEEAYMNVAPPSDDWNFPEAEDEEDVGDIIGESTEDDQVYGNLLGDFRAEGDAE